VKVLPIEISKNKFLKLYLKSGVKKDGKEEKENEKVRLFELRDREQKIKENVCN